MDNDYGLIGEWGEELVDIVESVVNDRCKDVKRDLSASRDIIGDLKWEIVERQLELDKIKRENKQLKTNLKSESLLKTLRDLVSAESNMFEFIASLGIKVTNQRRYIDGMSSQDIPNVVKLIIMYYNDKDVVLDILDMLNIDYAWNLREFKLPRDYELDKIRDIIENIDTRMIITNGCYFENNIGFWLAPDYKNKKEYPLQEVFKNPHMQDCTDLILDRLNKSDIPDRSFLYKVTSYQEYSDDFIWELANRLSGDIKKLNKYHKDFISRHKDILFSSDEFCDKYFKYASDNIYNVFAIHRFKKGHQLRFLKELPLEKSMEIIKRFDCDEDAKVRLFKDVIDSKI